MVTTRGLEAGQELEEALSEIGLPARAASSTDSDVDLWVSVPNGHDIAVQVKRVATPTLEGLRIWTQQPRPGGLGEQAPLRVLVADRVPQSMREQLSRHHIGWLDLRGHLRLAGGGLFIDSEVAARRGRPDRTSALAGAAGLEVACWLLMRPKEPVRVRAVAAELGRSPSTVSEVLKSLRAQDLVDQYGLTEPTELFAEVTERWQPSRTNLAVAPSPADPTISRALGLNLDPEQGVGWAATDTLAAAAYGAPVAARADHAPDFYVPDAATSRRAVQLLGAATTSASAGATIAVAPVPAVCGQRIDPLTLDAGRRGWPLAHPLFVAFDLARDPGRGREILQSWTPPQPWTRVW